MLKHKKTFKLAQLALLSACVYSAQALAEEPAPVEQAQAVAVQETGATPAPEADLLAQQLEIERKAEEARLALEKQQQAEEKLQQYTSNYELQAKSTVAKIYADNNYQPLWTDSAAEKAFLRDYTLVALSGISKKSARTLETLAQTQNAEGLLHDILLTDAFLDYLYYSKNVANSAQKWLYAESAYRTGTVKEEQLNAWLSAMRNNQAQSFIQSLSSNNRYYQQTVEKVIALAKNAGNKKTDAQLQKLAINAQRLRMLPAFENGIFVNIPTYQLNYYRDGKLELTSKVIVGKDERRTPVMQSKLSNVVVNPPWNAPAKLINEDIVPKVRRDPSYLERHGYSILDSRGNTIDPYSIDWNAMSSTKFPYRLRQAPSDDSALGRYKFNMPSSDAIYLHDTPNRGLFGKKDRALSSGCVRVEKSEQLATILLKEAGWDESKKSRVLESRKTTSASVRSHNPVFLYYATAWVSDGKVHTAPDIYRYDTKVNLDYLNWSVVKANLE